MFGSGSFIRSIARGGRRVVSTTSLGASKVATTAARAGTRSISSAFTKSSKLSKFLGFTKIALPGACAVACGVYLIKDTEWARRNFTTYADGKPTVVFVLGGPGAGKGTQCTNIVNNYGFVHLSAGDLLREEMATPGSPYGKMIDEIIKNGQIVPSHVTVGLLNNAMNKSAKKRFLIDGFPRNFENNSAFERELGTKVDIPFILFFDVPEDVMEKRLLKRGETSGRTDDNLASIKKRFKTFQEQTMPVIDYYAKLNKVVRVDGDRDPKAIFADLQKVFNQHFPSKK